MSIMSTLHITNGDVVANKRRSVFDGPVSITADVLHEGPACELDDAAWRDQRARYLASAGYTTEAGARDTLEEWDSQITQSGRYPEVALWFEHDLFDQLLLVRTLDMLDRLRGPARPAHVSLICVNTFLGHLSAAELRGLWPTRAPVTGVQYAIARRTWHAFRQRQPSPLLQLHHEWRDDCDRSAPMPFLADAIERWFEEFPSTTNGLSRTAHAVLELLGEGALPPAALFQRSQALEERIFLGDTSFFLIVRTLRDARVPLVAMPDNRSAEPAVRDDEAAPISITDAGRAVLRGALDAVRLNGLDVWRGGLHLAGDVAPWRWDPARKTLISCQ
jgi:hypothetical protein